MTGCTTRIAYVEALGEHRCVSQTRARVAVGRMPGG